MVKLGVKKIKQPIIWNGVLHSPRSNFLQPEDERNMRLCTGVLP